MKWKERRPCRNIPYLVFFVISCSVIIYSYFYHLMPLLEDTSFRILPASIQDFVVNTSECQIPAWNPWDDTVKVFYKPVLKFKCTGPPSFLRILPNAVVSLDKTLLKYYYETDPQNVTCFFQGIHRDVSIIDENTDSRFILSPLQSLTMDKPLGLDFVKTSCSFIDNLDKKVVSFIEFLPLTPLKADVKYHATHPKGRLLNKPLNVIFIGLDSISRLNFMRHLKKCQNFHSNYSTLFTMKGYTKVGDNTFPNLMPLLTGQFYQHYYDENKNKTDFFDDVDFIWKVFSNLGYRTMLAEDAPDIATFNYYRRGFKNPPTDYYYRPFALAVENSEMKKNSKSHCFGSKMEMEVIYDYLKSFIDTYGHNQPLFSFIFLARLTHDLLNFAGYADHPTSDLLNYFEETGIFNDSLVIFFSDHGIRYGDIRKTYIGQFEERMPFMNMYVPKWFLSEHKTLKQNLNKNTERLTTPFDIHATLLHLASIISGDQKFVNIPEHGHSLFQEVSSNRTCSQASISAHWCPCQKIKLISTSDLLVQKAAGVIIDSINKKTLAYRDICSVLTLNKVLSARLVLASNSDSSNQGTLQAYLITLSALPSVAVFEATVQCENSKDKYCYVIDAISRINVYGKQSICIADAELRKFCYCNH